MLLDVELNSKEHNFEYSEGIPARFKSYEPFKKDMIQDVEDLLSFQAEAERGNARTLNPKDRQRFIKTMQNIISIYFICSPETCLVKIGRSNDIKKRLKTIRSISPYEITLLSTVTAHKSFEYYLHQKLINSRSHGEWFKADDRVLSVINISLDKGAKGVFEYLEGLTCSI